MFAHLGTASAAKSDSCAHRHGPDGNSTAAYPSLAGQTRDYLYRQIKAFKEGRRKDFRDGVRASDVMGPPVKKLSDEQIDALAQYLTSL